MTGWRYRAVWTARTALAVACAASGCAFLSGAAGAATFTVDNTDDSGSGSLRQAILDANASAGMDTIVFTLPMDSTITLTSDLDELTEPVTIDASDAPGLTVDGDANRILRTAGVDVELVDLAATMGEIQVGDSDTLTLTANNDFEISADVADAPAVVTPGSLVKEGAAVLTLSGNNTFTGLLTINDGTVVGDIDSLPGDIENDSALVFDQGTDGDYFGSISGSGSLEKTGAGILGLNAPNSYTGGTTVSEGVLVGDAISLQGDVEVADAAALGFVQNVDGEFAGDISGEGELIKIGPADLRLSGSNSYGGGTVVAEGTLTGDSQSLQGDMDLAGGNLVFDQPVDGSFGGDITGSGSVTKQGAGNLTIAGTNSYTGGTMVEDGTLTGNAAAIQGLVTLMPATTLVFDQSGAGTFAGTISGMGDVVKQGGGTLSIDTPQTYTGDTTILGGVLELTGTGSLTSATTVESGGTLSGTGTISQPVSVFGSLTPGGSAQGTFSVSGNTSFGAGSRLVVDMDASDSGDQLSATGDVDIDPAATLEIHPAPGDYTLGSTITVLNATGNVTGMFLEGEPFAFLDRNVDYPGGGVVTVTLMANGANLATTGQTPNQIAVGTALSTLTGSLDPDVQELFDNLNTLTASQAAPTLDSLSGESISAFSTARVALGERMQRTVQRRMRSLLFARDTAWPAGRAPRGSRPTRTPLSGSGSDVAAPPRLGERGVGAWIDGYGVVGTLDGDANSADVDYDLYGSTVGVDYRLGSHVLAGAAAGYARTELHVDARDADGSADTAQGALYAAWANRRVYAGLSGRYAWSNANQTRDIVAGSLRREARADFDSHDYGLRGEIAVDAFEAGPMVFEPLAGFEWNHLTREDFQESGAGGLGLDVASETLDTSLLQLGARLHGIFPMDEDSVLAPELRAYWLHEFGDVDRIVEASLDGAPFQVSGAEAPRDGALVGAGWAMTLGPNVRAVADYDLRIDSDRLEHVGSITIRVRF